MINIIIKTI